MKLSGTSFRAGLAVISLAAGVSSAGYAAFQTLQRMDGPTRAAIAALDALPDHAPDAQAWISAHTNWVLANETVQALPDLPGYGLRTAQVKPRSGVAFDELAALIAIGEQATPAWRVQEMDVYSVGPAKVDVSRLTLSRVERAAR